MEIDVALLPALLERPEGSVCVVVDALRATSSIAVILAGGAREIAVAPSIGEARALKAGQLPDALLCGEERALPPEGFDHGNSPVEFARLDLAGRRVILATSNGTRALALCAGAPAVFAGSLLNRAAVARAAAAEATARGVDLAFVCAGARYGQAFSVEDAGVCGALVEQVVKMDDGPLGGLRLTDGATAAYRIWRSCPAPRALMGESRHGQALAALGLETDLDLCAVTDRYDVAPRLHQTDEGLLVLRG